MTNQDSGESMVVLSFDMINSFELLYPIALPLTPRLRFDRRCLEYRFVSTRETPMFLRWLRIVQYRHTVIGSVFIVVFTPIGRVDPRGRSRSTVFVHDKSPHISTTPIANTEIITADSPMTRAVPIQNTAIGPHSQSPRA